MGCVIMSSVKFRPAKCKACRKEFVLGQAFIWVDYFNTGPGGDLYIPEYGVIHNRQECRQIIIDYSTKENWGNPVKVVVDCDSCRESVSGVCTMHNGSIELGQAAK